MKSVAELNDLVKAIKPQQNKLYIVLADPAYIAKEETDILSNLLTKLQVSYLIVRVPANAMQVFEVSSLEEKK